MLSAALESLDLWPLNDACNVSSGLCTCGVCVGRGGAGGGVDGDIPSHIKSASLGSICGFSCPLPVLHI